ncbi:MAG: TetR/AcrR family transcriptional regulator [Candidatus Puniceispirillales bacterium]
MAGRPEKYSQDMILDASVPLFWEKGIAALSVNTLTQELGVPKPSLYRHFDNEDGLRHAVLTTYEKQALQGLYACFERDASFTVSRDEYITLLIGGVTRYPKGCLMFQAREAANDMGPQTKACCDAIYGRFSTIVGAWLERAEARGEISLKTSPGTAIFMVMQTANLVRDAMREGLERDEVISTARLHLDSIIETA